MTKPATPGSPVSGSPPRSPADEALPAVTSGLSREDLVAWLGDAAKLWLAHDGLWFRSVEKHHGLADAIRLDEEAMAAWSAGEARRIVERLGLPAGGGLDALDRVLRARLYALLNRQEIRRERGAGSEGGAGGCGAEGERLVFTMLTCRVQDARNRQGLAPFPCRSVGQLEYAEFARVIDPRLTATCRFCPPDRPEASSGWCCWEFALRDH